MSRIIFSLFLLVTAISAQWSTDPAIPQSLGSGIKAQLAATSDGGVYVAWLSDGNNYHVYLQRLNSSGVPQWADNGMVVSDNTNASWIAVYHLNLAVDSEDNAIITTVDQRTGGQWNVYAYKVGPNGSMLWGDDGLALTDSSVSNISPRLAVLSDNSAVVTWTHNDNTVLFQRISSAGALLWGTGILIADDDATLISPQPIVTAEGDVLIQWIRQTGPFWAANSELYLQKYDYGGNPQWINPIIAAGPVVFPMGNWSQQSVAGANSGSFSAWTEMSGNVQSAGVQYITGEGALSWIGGVDLSTNSSNFHISPQLTIANDTQELMAIWKEKTGSQTQIGVYAQRLDNGGNRLWGANGTAVVALNSSYDYLDLSVAGFGEDMIATYIEQSVNMNGDIYAARLDADGNSVWMGERVTVTNSGNPKSDMMIAKGPGCLFIAWTEGGSVYTHCLREDGTLGTPGGVLLVPSEYMTIEEAIDAASDGDMVLVADGTYTGTGNKELTWDGTEKHIVVKSANGPENCIIDLENSGRAFSFVSGSGDNSIWITAADVIDGFTIRNGNSSSYGGAIYCYYGYQNDVSPTIRNCIFENNTSNYGGAIYIDGGSSLITNCVFDSNSANYGGAIYLGSAGGDTEPLIQQCTFTGNSTDQHWNGQGGAIYLTNVSTNEDCRIWNNTFDGNSAPNGGAIYFSTSSPEVSGNLFINNTGSTNASALYIYNYDGPTISNCTIANNVGTEAVYCHGFNGTVEPVFINTIIWGSDSSFGFQDTSQANPIISYCNLESGFPITGTDGGSNISADPFFCNPDNGDYTLVENSPCIAAGSNESNIGAFGIGCDEPFAGPIWHVSQDGSDSTGSGSMELPFRTIQYAITSVDTGDTVIVHQGTYVENVNFNGKSIVLASNWLFTNDSTAIDSTIIDGNNNGPVVNISSGEDTTTALIGFTIRNGNGVASGNYKMGGGLYIGGSSPSIRRVTIENNEANGDDGGRGGGIYISDSSDVSLIRSTIRGNHSQWGGGIYAKNSRLVIRFTTLINDSASGSGGGLYLDGVHLNARRFNCFNNVAVNSGGGVYATGGSDVVIRRLALNRNRADLGGAFCFSDSSTIELNDGNINLNNAQNGGGIWASAITATIGAVSLQNNTAEDLGGAMHLSNNSHLVATDMVVINNSANRGGGVSILNSVADFVGGEINNNNAWRGGGIFSSRSDLDFFSITVTQNNSEDIGGGLLSISTNLVMDSTNVTFNSSDSSSGGGIRCLNFDSTSTYDVVITNSFISRNNAYNSGAGAFFSTANDDTSGMDILIENTRFIRNNGNHYTGLRIYGLNTQFEVNNCIFRGNNAVQYAAGSGFSGSCTGSVNHSLFAFNHAATAGGNFNSGGTTVWSGADVDFDHCTFANNTAAYGTALTVGAATAAVTNSIIWGDSTSNHVALNEWDGTGGTLDISYTDIIGGSQAVQLEDQQTCILSWGAGNLTQDPLFCLPDSGIFSLAENSPCVATADNGSNLGMFGIGCDAIILSTIDELLPAAFALHQNYPNPFNPVTTIKYDLPENSQVQIAIYDMLGRKVRTLAHGFEVAGFKAVQWRGRNDFGQSVGAGVYICQIRTRDFVQTRKMILLK